MAVVACSEARKRLDETLKSHTLAERNNVRRLVQNQLLKSSLHKPTVGDARGDVSRRNNKDKLVEKRFTEVWDALEMLRSAADIKAEDCKAHESSAQGWKLKQDTNQFRVMYREGPVGTPFHTLLLEGYIDGPIDSCLCVGLEASLYPQWWPQFVIPTFKVIESRCLKRVRIGEEISLVRLRVPWPLSTREIVFHYFELEYFEGDLLIVLLDSVPDSEQLDESVHGFNSEGIPPMEGIIRMELVGGFALQKVSSTQSYFRTIGNLDIKLDIVPAWVINFISRQLIGHGFKLYQKAVLAASSGDESFRKIIEHGPMYIRIRAGLRHAEASEREKKSCHYSIEERNEIEEIEERTTKGTGAASKGFHGVVASNGASTSRVEPTLFSEIEVEGNDAATGAPTQGMDFLASKGIEERCIKERLGYVDPQILKALKVLDNVIAFAQANSPRATLTSTVQTPGPVTTAKISEWSSSLQDQISKGVTEGPFPPRGKVSQSIDKIGRHGEVRRDDHKGETKMLLPKVHPKEHHASKSVKNLKSKSKQISCCRVPCWSKNRS